MSADRITFRFSTTATLESLWFDQQWLDEMLAAGWSRAEALREMVREGMKEDPTSMLEEVCGSDIHTLADGFVEHVYDIRLTSATEAAPKPLTPESVSTSRVLRPPTPEGRAE